MRSARVRVYRILQILFSDVRLQIYLGQVVFRLEAVIGKWQNQRYRDLNSDLPACISILIYRLVTSLCGVPGCQLLQVQRAREVLRRRGRLRAYVIPGVKGAKVQFSPGVGHVDTTIGASTETRPSG